MNIGQIIFLSVVTCCIIFLVYLVAYTTWAVNTTKKWRKDIRVGDRAAYRNLLGKWTAGVVQSIDAEGVLLYVRLDSSTGYQTHKLERLYPLKVVHPNALVN